MAELIVVYRTSPDNVQRTLQVLASRHLHPVLLDEPAKASRYRPGDLLVRIAVPETERDMATAILAEAEQQTETRLAPAMKTIRAGFLLMAVAAALVVAMGLIDTGGRWFAVTLIVLGLVFVAVFLWAIRRPKP
jgi:Flp pilus assembly protein TadB